MLNFDRSETKFALDIVRQASLLVKKVQAEMVSPALTKDDRSPVTVADFASQALIGWALAEAFPNHSLVGEEDAADEFKIHGFPGKSVLPQHFFRRVKLQRDVLPVERRKRWRWQVFGFQLTI